MRRGDDGVVFGQVNVDLGSNAEFAFEIDAGLDRKCGARDEAARVAGLEVVDVCSVAVAFFADRMAGAV